MKLFSLLLNLARRVIDKQIFICFLSQQVGGTQLSNYLEVIKGLYFGMAITIAPGIKSYRWGGDIQKRSQPLGWSIVFILPRPDTSHRRMEIIMPTMWKCCED